MVFSEGDAAMTGPMESIVPEGAIIPENTIPPETQISQADLDAAAEARGLLDA